MMVITLEKVELLANTLLNDIDFANEIVEMEAEDAVAVLKEKGYDFTVEELGAFAEDLLAYLEETDQLNEEDLDDVSGGCYHHHHRRPPYHRHTHYHYGPYCITIRYKNCRW